MKVLREYIVLMLISFFVAVIAAPTPVGAEVLCPDFVFCAMGSSATMNSAFPE